MNILFVSNHYYPKPDPNAKRITGIAQNLVKLGHQVTVITSGEISGSSEVNGVEVNTFTSSGNFSKGRISRGLNHIDFLSKAALFKKKSKDYDFVIATSPSPFNFISGRILARRFKAKFIIDIRDIWPEVFVQTGVASEYTLTYKIFKFISKSAYKHADAILVVTPGKVELLTSMYPKYREKIHLISNGLDVSFLDNLRDEDFEDELEKYSSKINIVYIGNVGLAQNLKPFILSLNELDNENIYFHILGKGNKLQELLDFSESIGYKNLVNHGLRNESEVYTMLTVANFTYVSLVSDLLKDSIPTKIFESLAMGVPILLSASGDAADLVKASRLGIVNSVSSEHELKNRIVEMLNQEQSFKESVAFSKEHVIENYSREKITKSLVTLLENL